ncbi:MAG: aminotransferase class V-fold PLP-dependent enzyme, partial [bacterium]
MNVYLDNNATTRVAPEVLDSMLQFFNEDYGNASSMHTFGGRMKKHIELGREKTAALLNADPQEIIFTSCGTESDNTAIRNALDSAPNKRHIITTRVEHPAILSPADYMEKKGYRITRLSVNKYGFFDLAELEQALTDDTAIVSIMWANNETGVVFPIEEAARLAKSRGAIFHTDAVQAAGKIAIDMKKIPVDMLSISGHKLHAPKGIGALYVRRGTPFVPFMLGGHQESGRRAGTENVPYIAGLGRACELAAANMDEENTVLKELRDRLETALLAK